MAGIRLKFRLHKPSQVFAFTIYMFIVLFSFFFSEDETKIIIKLPLKMFKLLSYKNHYK